MWRRPEPATTASVNGPRNSIDTAVPSGRRATAWKKHRVIAATATPKARIPHHSDPDRPRSEGRATSVSTIAPSRKRNPLVVAAPITANAGTPIAAEDWIDVAATSTQAAPTTASWWRSVVVTPRRGRRGRARARRPCLRGARGRAPSGPPPRPRPTWPPPRRRPRPPPHPTSPRGGRPRRGGARRYVLRPGTAARATAGATGLPSRGSSAHRGRRGPRGAGRGDRKSVGR